MILKFKKYVFLRIFFHFIYILAIAGLPVVIRYMIDSTYSNGISKEPYDFNKNTISDYNSKFISIKKEL